MSMDNRLLVSTDALFLSQAPMLARLSRPAGTTARGTAYADHAGRPLPDLRRRPAGPPRARRGSARLARVLPRPLMRSGAIGFAEAYRDGLWETDDLRTLSAFRRHERRRAGSGHPRWLAAGQLLYPGDPGHLFRRTSRAGSRRNIHAHDYLGKRFYRLWLDPGMTYSAAWFGGGDRALAAGQRAKYERILQHLHIGEGAHILEIGCGWGAFADTPRATGDAVSRASRCPPSSSPGRIGESGNAGLLDLVEFRLQDYRDLQGQFDAAVSIEMLEAVGEAYWPTYFGKLRQVLRPRFWL